MLTSTTSRDHRPLGAVVPGGSGASPSSAWPCAPRARMPAAVGQKRIRRRLARQAFEKKSEILRGPRRTKSSWPRAARPARASSKTTRMRSNRPGARRGSQAPTASARSEVRGQRSESNRDYELPPLEGDKTNPGTDVHLESAKTNPGRQIPLRRAVGSATAAASRSPRPARRALDALRSQPLDRARPRPRAARAPSCALDGRARDHYNVRREPDERTPRGNPRARARALPPAQGGERSGLGRRRLPARRAPRQARERLGSPRLVGAAGAGATVRAVIPTGIEHGTVTVL